MSDAQKDPLIESAVEIESLRAQVLAATSDAEYAWTNARTIERARQEEMAKRDAAQAEVAALRTGDTCARQCEGTAYRIEARRLRHHLTELARFADRAALVLATIEAEDTTEGEMLQEIIDGVSKWAPPAILGQVSVPPAPTSKAD